MALLSKLLREKFGFNEFRLSQRQVCEAVTNGEDTLLVMPTGAGKSLCYQLPGLARGGTTLVISPLLALIDDQTAKLKALGIRAEQIHSGRTREQSREACIKYLNNEIDFLFVAPERLGVPGFPEMLQKRKPVLIAIDEAHCISQWGHDFRPEYRKLGERLAGLRPTPIIALTATATPLVQGDILRQLGILNAKKFIQGFRRTNIAIQAFEVPPSNRIQACIKLLHGKTPAIVYASTRKNADEYAEALKKSFKAEAYHAGMKAASRDDMQTRFLSGDLDVIVATVAFGMGIDKADVRCVVHAGLPGSVESYYQEIGRAGRDGKDSSAIMLYAFSDQKMHEFFFERDYPEKNILMSVFEKTTANPMPKSDLYEKVFPKLDNEIFNKALEKLWIHGGVLVDPDENVTRSNPAWINTYTDQRNHREQTMQTMLRFMQSSDCRMLSFLKHFGDTHDQLGPCGKCDKCQNEHSIKRELKQSEFSTTVQIMACLSKTSGMSIGKLYDEVSSVGRSVDRKEFEEMVELLSHEKYILVRQETFEKNGRQISFRKAWVTAIGESVGAEDLQKLQVVAGPEWMQNLKNNPSRKRRSKAKLKKSLSEPSLQADPEFSNTLFEKLRAWRLAKARQQGVPAFRILSDKVLLVIAEHRPRTLDALLEVHGFGEKLRDKYGGEILDCLSS